MITYRITCMFAPDWSNLYPALFGANVHCASVVGDTFAQYTFEDASVKPADLGPLVRVEVIPNP
jgi:hypothetical protein